MLDGLARYESYKDSGIPWLSEVPTDWDIQRAKWLFTKMERPVRSEDDVVTAFRDGQVTLRTNRRTEGFTNAIQEHGYQGIREGDLVIHAMDAFAGAIGVSESNGKSSPVYAACVPRGIFDVAPRYYAYALRYVALSGYILSLAKGIRERSTDFRFKDFGDMDMPVPDLDTQNRIVKFLDEKTAEIDAAIQKKRRLIDLLNEQKAILINRAVTKGLNPNAPMKDSGVDWIGEIPAHWDIVPLMAVSEVIDPNPSHRNPEYVDEGFPFISTQEFNGWDEIEINTPRRVSEKTVLEQERRCRFRKGSIVFSRKGTIGATRVLPFGVRLGILDSLCVINPKNGVTPEYLVGTLGADYLAAQYGPTVKGAALPQLSVGKVRSLKVILPPSQEQIAIQAELASIKAEHHRLDEVVQREIATINEFKQTLIANAVTGKIKI